MGIGAVLVDGAGNVVARGRNRVLERPGSGGAVAGTLLAHAEMDAFGGLGLSTAEGLTLYTTVEPCLMCASTAIAMRTELVCSATADPVFEGLDEALGRHPYCQDRLPAREILDDPVLSAFARVLPLASRVWSRPGVEPRSEWVRADTTSWAAAVTLIESGTLSALARAGARVTTVVEEVAPVLL